MDISTEVIGFHGTNLDVAARIVVGDVEFSTQSYDWLGDGFYLLLSAILVEDAGGGWRQVG